MKKVLCMILTLMMVVSVCTCALSVSAAETTVEGLTVTKISNPEAGEREVDGLIEGGDRENSYTWRLAQRGDEIYIATTRNIASALVNMYGGEFAKAGIDIDTFWSMIDVVTNGDIPRNDANEGANIISYNRKTGDFKVIYTAGTGDYFRMAVTFGDNVYFGSYSAVSTNPQYILKLDPDGNFTKVFETMGSVSLRANCVYDEGDGEHLYFAGADDRTPIAEGEAAPVAKMAVLRKSNEDDTVWERVADFRDFGTTAYDPIHTSWAGAPIWELANHDGYIYATAPTHAGFVIYKGHPAEGDEEANEYGWNWTEVAGLTNGVNNPGLSDVKGGEPGTMRSLIGSVYEYNGELYAYNFDHSFGGEASAFAGMMQQLAGQDVKASDYLFYLYDSLQNPQKVWKLNDETGKFEELTAFTDLMEGTTNEYVWRLGEYNGDLYVATMDAGIFYNYLTQLTNGSFFDMTQEEKMQKVQYIGSLIKGLAVVKGNQTADQLKAKLEELKNKLLMFALTEVVDETTIKVLAEYAPLINEIKTLSEQLIKDISESDLARVAQSLLRPGNDEKDLAPTGAAMEVSAVGAGISLLPDGYLDDLREKAQTLTETLSYDTVKEMLMQQLKTAVIGAIRSVAAFADELYSKIDGKGIEMYLYINNAVMKDEWGFDLFRTCDGGNSFEVITRDGFGDKYNYGCPAFLETEEGLYLGTCNPFYGGQLYLIHDDNAPAIPDDPDDPDEPYMPELRAWYMLGDADGDDEITILDATVIERYLASIISEEYIDPEATDVSRDGIDITDATFIQRYLASMETPHSIGERFNRATGEGVETIEETLLLDKAGVKVMAKSFGREYVPYMTIRVENSTQKEAAVTFMSIAVNGYETSGDFFIEDEDGGSYTNVASVAADETIELRYEFSGYDVLADSRFSVFADLAFVTSVIDPQSYDTIDFEKASVMTSAYEGYAYNFDESGDVIYDKNGVKIVVKSETDGIYEMPQLYISNQSDKDIAVNTTSCKVNGADARCNIGGYIYSGNRTIREMFFFEPVKEGDQLTFALTIYELNEKGVFGAQLDVTDAYSLTI